MKSPAAINKRKAYQNIGLEWLIPAVVVVLWQWFVSAGLISQRILPTPVAVVEAGIKLVRNGDLFVYIGDSSRRALLGFVIGGGIGFALAIINGLLPLFEKLTDSSIQMIRTIPHLSLIPLIIAWFGIGEQGKIFLVALGVAFPIYLNTLHGIRAVDPGLIEMGRTYGLRGFSLFRTIIFPGALPSILVGLRFALGIMWITLIVSETISANSGIGYMAMNAREFFQMDIVVLSIVIYALLGKLSDWIAKVMERSWLQWHPHYRKGK
ncbi:binding-protein-dependent transport systems inner membrane component [Paenibacillus curdlanolyticus YK9]|uniref:Binding-protein-dependent transport systems inner membrane component n=1 Tax=Paenibacillus curdlanolyticus YK9 TaxID=717606 RepID=E0I3S7_9BACL|nr:ABC transporter permease subunit [Paenibacillus curdlanolyticus]EFM12941.1 binding-protein-dependent transport systems inner membrane component [Paenibacillus curdlanolyticus YK9]